MAVEERDPVSGQKTTGHEWNGIKELDTAVPRGVLIFLVVTHVWAVLWWLLMPTWPLVTTYTKGILGIAGRHAARISSMAAISTWTGLPNVGALTIRPAPRYMPTWCTRADVP